MFRYRLYGKYITTNVKLPLLNHIDNCGKCDLTLTVSFDNITGNTVSVKAEGPFYIVELSPLAVYHIDPTNNIISCKAQDFESFFSTFFNIPFSVYSLCKDEVLYHACSLICNNKLLCLTGEKGVGKSTVMQILGTKNDFEIFSDDTVYIGKDSRAFCAHNLIKHTSETIEALRLKTLHTKNAAGKYYSYFEYSNAPTVINKIFHLSRTNEQQFHLKQIHNQIIINNIFRTNIVGCSHIPQPLLTKVLKMRPDPHIEFYELSIPNDLSFLINHSEALNNLILNSFEGDFHS